MPIASESNVSLHYVSFLIIEAFMCIFIGKLHPKVLYVLDIADALLCHLLQIFYYALSYWLLVVKNSCLPANHWRL